MSLKDKYCIVGVGYTPQGSVPGRTSLSFHVEACANAIKDAGLKREDIDGLMCYRYYEPLVGEHEVTPYLVAQHLGLAPKLLSQEGTVPAPIFSMLLEFSRLGFATMSLSVMPTTPYQGAVASHR